MPDRPAAATARLHVLHAGYVRSPERRVASTVTYVHDGDLRLVVDPGLVTRPGAILDPLAELGVRPPEVTDVVFSHHHPDHTINAALFPNARFHDHWATYSGDLWLRPEETDRDLSGSVRLIGTPGHTPQDVTTLVGTPDGLVALTHLWWAADGPPEDPFATDPAALHAGRERILALADLIVPGHGQPFTPAAGTPR
jgi:glyoxylase-like metal-dependent hydrolase (beta-lactamase superfamily II)